MTNAGEAVGRRIARRWPEAMARGVLVVAGKGNNGGDGLVAARRLHQTGERARAGLLARRTDLRGDASRACSDLDAMGRVIIEVPHEPALAAALGGPAGGINYAIVGPGV